MRTRSMTRYSMLAVAGMTALAAVACGSSDKGGGSTTEPSVVSATTSVAPATTTAAASAAPAMPSNDGDDEVKVAGSIASVSGSSIEVTGLDGTASTVAFAPTAKVRELTPIDLADIKPGSCVTVRPASGAEGGTVVAEALVTGAASGGPCAKTGSADNGGLAPTTRGGFRGAVDSVDGKTILLTTLGADGSKTQSTIQIDDTTILADRHAVGVDAVVEGKCIVAGGLKDSAGVLQASTINLPLVIDGKCPQLKP